METSYHNADKCMAYQSDKSCWGGKWVPDIDSSLALVFQPWPPCMHLPSSHTRPMFYAPRGSQPLFNGEIFAVRSPNQFLGHASYGSKGLSGIASAAIKNHLYIICCVECTTQVLKFQIQEKYICNGGILAYNADALFIGTSYTKKLCSCNIWYDRWMKAEWCLITWKQPEVMAAKDEQVES